MTGHSRGHEFAVTDVAFDELDARVFGEISQGVFATCVGKRIDDGDFIITVGHQKSYEVRTDKAGATRYKDFHGTIIFAGRSGGELRHQCHSGAGLIGPEWTRSVLADPSQHRFRGRSI